MIAIIRTPETSRSRDASTAPTERSLLLQYQGDEITYETLPEQENGSIRHSSPPRYTRKNDGANDDSDRSTGSDTLVDAGAKLDAFCDNVRDTLSATVATTKQATATLCDIARRTPCFLLTWTWRTLVLAACLTLIYALPVLSYRFLIERLIRDLHISISKKDLLAGARVSEVLGAAMQIFFAAMVFSLWHVGREKKGKQRKSFAGLVWEALRASLCMEACFGATFLVTAVVIWGWKGIEIGTGHEK